MAKINNVFPTGFAMVQGSVINAIIAVVNNLSGNGTRQALTASTINANGVATLSGGGVYSGAQKDTLTTVAAAGATLGTATAIPATANAVLVTVTASTEGIKLPTAATGLVVTVLADPSVGNKVYAAAAGQVIGANSTATTAYVLVKNTVTIFYAISATKWRTAKGS